MDGGRDTGESIFFEDYQIEEDSDDSGEDNDEVSLELTKTLMMRN